MAAAADARPLPAVSVERQLLLACARVDESPAADEAVRRSIRREPDWALVLRIGGRHGLLPIVHRRLRDMEGIELPASVAGALRSRYYTAAQRNLRYTARLVEIVDALEERGVPVLPLKGPGLAMAVYPNLALREFGDLDLLVRTEDVARACAVLPTIGVRPLDDLDGGRRAAFRAIWYSYGWNDAATDTFIDLHWRLAPLYFPLALDQETIWRETERIPMHGRPVRAFRPEMLLLTLCVHGAKHEPDPWARLNWIRDVAEVVRASPGLDWDRLRTMARAAGCRRLVDIGLLLAHRLMAAPLPDPVLRRARSDEEAERLTRELAHRLLTDASPCTPLGRIRWELRMRERLRDRARVLLRRAALPDTRDLAAVRLPRALAPLYIPVRLARLAGKAVRRPGALRRLGRPMANKSPVVRM